MSDPIQVARDRLAKQAARREQERQAKRQQRATEDAYRAAVAHAMTICRHDIPEGTKPVTFYREAAKHFRALARMLTERGTVGRIERECQIWSEAEAGPDGFPETAAQQAMAAEILRQAADPAVKLPALAKAIQKTADDAHKLWGLSEAMETILKRLDSEDSRVEPKPATPAPAPTEAAPIARPHDTIMRQTEPVKDGPLDGDSFHWRGETYDGLSPTPYRLIKLLWPLKGKPVAFEDLAEDVYQDQAGRVRKNQVGSTRRDANRFFRKCAIPCEITTRNRHVRLVLRDE